MTSFQTKRHCLFLALSVAAFVQTARAADSVLLKPKSAAGETYVEVDTDTQQKIVGPDKKPMEIKARSVYGVLQKAKGKGEVIEIEATLDRLLGATEFSASIKSLYDTDDPDYEDASPFHRDAFSAIQNMAFKMNLDGHGLVTEINGGDAIRKKLKDLGDQNFVAKSLAEIDLSDGQIKSNFGEKPMAIYPNRDVKVGESWTTTVKDEFPQVGRVIMKYDCRLEKTDGGDLAIVKFNGAISKDEDEKATKDMRPGKIEGSFTGTAKFDAKAGRFVDIQREWKVTSEIQPWWTKDQNAPLMKVDEQGKQSYVVSSTEDRRKKKAEIAARVAEAKAKREAEEAAAMAEPVDPVTPENAPVAWTQWGGPKRDFKSPATGLANRWPKGGPPKLWERTLGDGFATILCENGVLYTTYSARDKEDPMKGEEVVAALDAKTGKTLWEYRYAAPWTKDMQMEFGAGPYSTPVIVGDRIFSIGVTAKLAALDKKSGKVLWSKDLREEYKAVMNMRGYGSSPLAYKGNILLPVNKEKGFGVMAFSQEDGSVAWKGGEFTPGYASLLPIHIDGTEELVAFSSKAVLGLDASDASTKWSVDHPTQWGANISTPVWGDDGMLFISSAYGMGSRGVKVEKKDGAVIAKEAWFNPKMKIQHGDAVRVGDWIYGSSGDFGPTFLACVNAKTGKFGWQTRGIARANVLYADGKIIVLDEDGSLFLVKADPTKYRLLGKMTGLCKKTAWTVPTLVGRTLYVRDREKITALNLGADGSSS